MSASDATHALQAHIISIRFLIERARVKLKFESNEDVFNAAGRACNRTSLEAWNAHDTYEKTGRVAVWVYEWCADKIKEDVL